MIKEHVSICVITYNSSKTVIETLDSILNQTYGANNLELIIADDASKDSTTIVIENWLNQHKEKFYRVEFIKHQENGGVSKNINSAWKSATCDWIKSIAGDDLLTIDAIDKYQNAVSNNPNSEIFFSLVNQFMDDINKSKPFEIDIDFFSKEASEQNKLLSDKNFLPAPSSYIKRNLLEVVGYADERYILIEDYPLWYKITKVGVKLNLINDSLVYYRVFSGITNSSSNAIQSNVDFYIDIIRFLNEINKTYGVSENRKKLSRIYKKIVLSNDFAMGKSENYALFFYKFISVVCLLLSYIG